MTAKLDQSRLALVLGLSEACITIQIKPLRFAWPSKATSKTTLKIPSSISNPEKMSNDCGTTFIQKSYTHSHIPEILYTISYFPSGRNPPKNRGANPQPSPDSKVAVLRSTGGRFTSAVMDKGMTNWNSSPGIKHRCSSWWLSHLKTMWKNWEHLQFVGVKITILMTSLEDFGSTLQEKKHISNLVETKKEFGS